QFFSNRPSGRIFGIANDAAVEGVAFDGFAAGFDDQALDLVAGEEFGGGSAGVVIDELVADGAVDVVGAVGEGRLRGANAKHDPVGLDVRDVVEHEPTDGDGPQIHDGR